MAPEVTRLNKPKKKNNSKSIQVPEKELSIKRSVFVEAYVRCLNGVQAYQVAYPDSTYDSALVNASRLLVNDNIKESIKSRLAEEVMPKEEIVKRWQDQARATLFPFIRIDTDGFAYFDFSHPDAKQHFHLIKKIKTMRKRWIEGKGKSFTQWEGEWIAVELHDPQKALEMLTKIHGMISDVPNVNINNTVQIVNARISTDSL